VVFFKAPNQFMENSPGVRATAYLCRVGAAAVRCRSISGSTYEVATVVMIVEKVKRGVGTRLSIDAGESPASASSHFEPYREK